MEIKSAFIIGALLAATPVMANGHNNANLPLQALNGMAGSNMPLNTPASNIPLNTPASQVPLNTPAFAPPAMAAAGVNISQINTGNISAIATAAPLAINAGPQIANGMIGLVGNSITALAVGNSSIVVINR